MAMVNNTTVSTSDGGGGGSAYSSGTGTLSYTSSNFRSGSQDLAGIVRFVDDYNNISLTTSGIYTTLESYKLNSNTIDYMVNTASTDSGGHAWGNEKVSTNYYYKNEYGSYVPIPFVSKASTPCIKTSSYSPGYVYCAKLEAGKNYLLKYVPSTSTEECKIQYSVTGTSSWTTVSTGAHGIFLLLQGAGGGGGSGDFEGSFLGGRNQGGGGGGGGGCVLVYINLKKLYLISQSLNAIINIGVGGSYNSSKKTAGSSGSSTFVNIGSSIDNYHKISALGGGGGDYGSSGRGASVEATGGSGGSYSEYGTGDLYSNESNRCMHIVATCNGVKGGNSGYVSKTNADSSNGYASNWVGWLSPKYFNGIISMRCYDVGSYSYGKGTYALKYYSSTTESGGGGGGASFCGGAILTTSSDQASRMGYGMGGQGARTNRDQIAGAGSAGQDGVCYILKNYI